MRNFLKIMSVILVCVVFFCVGTACNGQENKSANPQKHTLYCGLVDADAGEQLLTIEEAQAVARAVILENGCGYTEFVTYGGYMSNGKVINNDTLVYEIYFAECDAVNKITKEIQEKLNLMPILTAEGTTDYGFAE